MFVKTIIALGFFDGVHTGHRQILKATIAQGEKLGLTPCALTMKNHPKGLLTGRTPLKLTSFAQKKQLIEQLGIAEVYAEEFTQEFADLSPLDFAVMVKEKYHAAAVVYGENYAFGKKGAGWGEYGKSIWKSIGIEPFCVNHVETDGVVVSSTQIRALLFEGNVAKAAQLLGRYFSLTGTVEKGAQKGRLIGFPTINLAHKKGYALPGSGVYLTQIGLEKGEKHYGITNVGVRPTLYSDSHIFIETHILDYSGDLYGKAVKVDFIEKIRDEHKYPTFDDLKLQIEKDQCWALEKIAQLHAQPLKEDE